MPQDVREIILEVIQAVSPIVGVIVLLQLLVLRMPAPTFGQFLIGAAMVTVGLFLFLVGVRVGFLPVGEAAGSALAARGSLLIFLAVSFILGFAVTIAEPDVRVLVYQVGLASGGRIPTGTLICAVALGVALFVSLAILRLIAGIPITYLLAAGYSLVMILSFFTPPEFVPISFDAGGVTTGPMAVPFILALGIGTASVLGGKSALRDGFGLLGLASIGPVIGVMLVGVFLG